MKRRQALFSLGALMAAPALAVPAKAAEVHGYPEDMALNPDSVPQGIRRGGVRLSLTDDTDYKTVKVVFDRLMPADELGPSASEAGCLDFLDAQLAGPFGEGQSLYRDKPLDPKADEMMQVPQFIATPRERYDTGLKALEAYARKTDGASFADLQPNRQDEILEGMENGTISLGPDINTKAFFELMLQNVREGYFADPLYGGNKDMVGWKMIGFPGARYDYRAYTDKNGQKLGLEPVSLIPRD
ncbi:gluconate 2-dehydrogenase subunit 3 family protein [Rhizobium sp. 2MFCol3.1]|uniref:gluconate 2-dehydrogenase subunit 3 family protein n=1 Tax=Rhizobium sp. 2MFCol3.1 TaxID=1246459 RepID=UPI00047664D9|nr:gluconate 2-dehydrogenase subunit 3 family protein [Rhizobium sp. 2MFCol3.1]